MLRRPAKSEAEVKAEAGCCEAKTEDKAENYGLEATLAQRTGVLPSTVSVAGCEDTRALLAKSFSATHTYLPSSSSWTSVKRRSPDVVTSAGNKRVLTDNCNSRPSLYHVTFAGGNDVGGRQRIDVA